MSAAEDCEGVAAELLAITGCDDPPVEAVELAELLRFSVRTSPRRRAYLDAAQRRIVVPANGSHRKRQMLIAHELGHWALRRGGVEDSEDGARYVGGALMMPREAMRGDIRRTAWSVLKLQERHENVSCLALAVRITQLRDAVVTIFDPAGLEKPWRRPSPWITDRRMRKDAPPSRWERRLAETAWRERREIHGDELCYAVPVIDEDRDGEDRVIVVCELEQLALRL